jgi:hypothetical protein
MQRPAWDTQPRTDVNRITASAIYHRPLDERRLWATTVAYGANSELNIRSLPVRVRALPIVDADG